MHHHGDSSIETLGSKFLYKSKCTFGVHSFTSVKTYLFQDLKEVFAIASTLYDRNTSLMEVLIFISWRGDMLSNK